MRACMAWVAVGLVLAVAAPACRGAAPGADKSVTKAVLLSLIAPGAGQAYMGHAVKARTMLAAEAGIWGCFAFFRVQGGMREDRYKDTARLSAGVEREMDDYYYKMLAYYESSDAYNMDVMREARQLFPDDRARQLEFLQAEGYFGEDTWEWDSLDRMNDYARVRTLSRQSYRRATLTTGFAVLNRMISVIDVYLSHKLGSDAHTLGLARSGLALSASGGDGVRVYLRVPF